MSVWSWSGKGKATDFRTQDEFSEWMCTISKKISINNIKAIHKSAKKCRIGRAGTLCTASPSSSVL